MTRIWPGRDSDVITHQLFVFTAGKLTGVFPRLTSQIFPEMKVIPQEEISVTSWMDVHHSFILPKFYIYFYSSFYWASTTSTSFHALFTLD